jgi:polyferredoxin
MKKYFYNILIISFIIGFSYTLIVDQSIFVNNFALFFLIRIFASVLYSLKFVIWVFFLFLFFYAEGRFTNLNAPFTIMRRNTNSVWETCDYDLLVFDDEIYEDFYDYHNAWYSPYDLHPPQSFKEVDERTEVTMRNRELLL